MGLFGPETLEEHLDRIEKRSQKEVTTAQNIGALANGAIDTGMGLTAGVAIAVGDQYLKALEAAKNGEAAPGTGAKSTARDIAQKAEGAASESIPFITREDLNLKNLWEISKKSAQENPKTAAVIIGGSVMLGALDYYLARQTYKQMNNAEIGDSIRAIQKQHDALTPEQQADVHDRVLGKWTRQAIAEQATTAEPDMGRS